MSPQGKRCSLGESLSPPVQACTRLVPNLKAHGLPPVRKVGAELGYLTTVQRCSQAR
jgi:hypothetical protein